LYGRWAILSGLKPRHKNLFQFMGSNGKIRAIGRYRLWLKKNKIFFIHYLTQADLMILHHSEPGSDVGAYQAMERAVRDGKLRSIGLSNYYTPEDFDRLVEAATIVPVLLQNETHPYHQSMEMKEHLNKYGTVMESWFPLGGRGNTQILFNDETIVSIGEAHGKTSAQIILRWHLQAGNIAIPGSSNEDHIQENYEIFDFELSEEEMQKMGDLDRGERFADY